METKEKKEGEESKPLAHFSLSADKINWLTEAIVPILLVLIIWPAYYLIGQDHPYAYERVFSGGDLFAITFTLMLSSTYEFTSFIPKQKAKNTASETKAMLKLIGAILLVITSISYALAKVYTMEHAIPDVVCEPLAKRFTLLANYSLASCCAILGFIYYGKSCLEKYK